jgi:hypothetical protein
MDGRAWNFSSTIYTFRVKCQLLHLVRKGGSFLGEICEQPVDKRVRDGGCGVVDRIDFGGRKRLTPVEKDGAGLGD